MSHALSLDQLCYLSRLLDDADATYASMPPEIQAVHAVTKTKIECGIITLTCTKLEKNDAEMEAIRAYVNTTLIKE